ncbi:hypothetical protein llg_28520 [Luteolibacter sp. LG18]|nr:hypothetical protein llg_28520 [Luteolibacter sp. LG18]
MWQEAWNTLELIPADQQGQPRVLRLRLRCCAELDGWAVGLVFATILQSGGPKDRRAAAMFFKSLAQREVRLNRLPQARSAIRMAIKAWSEIRLPILADSSLCVVAAAALP